MQILKKTSFSPLDPVLRKKHFFAAGSRATERKTILAVWGRLGPFAAVWSRLGPFGTVWDRLEPSGMSGAVWGRLGPSGILGVKS